MLDIQKEVEKQVVSVHYRITMDEATARLLYDISGRISGCPTKSRRGIMDRIRKALIDTGDFPYGADQWARDLEGGLALTDVEKP